MQVGSIFSSLHTDVDDPIDRIKAIARSTELAKQDGEVSPMVDVLQLMGALSPIVAQTAAGLWSRNHLSKYIPMNISTVVTNVPGPNFDLYCAGARMVDYYAAVSQNIFDAAGDAVDVFFIGNDLGSQHVPLLSEAMFRRFLLPHLARLVDLGHAYGLKVMMHCCGGFAELIPALIEIGLDGVHALQPCCRGMGLERLKADFGDKILLNGAIDSQHVLIDGTPDTVRRDTREVLAVMKPGGGYVAGASHDTILEETPVENVLAMFDMIREFGRYADG